MDTENVIEKAAAFALEKHGGQVRKLGELPYILHPMEVAVICASMTHDQETIAAGFLHDTVEDCGVDPAEILAEFGEKTAKLVASETENKDDGTDPQLSWLKRKKDSLAILAASSDINVKILWISDKLSNLRSFVRFQREKGTEPWPFLHQKDKNMHAWYYRSIAAQLQELKGTGAYRELSGCYTELFGGSIEDGV